MKLTKKTVDKIPLGSLSEASFFWDETLPGFGLKVSATKKVYICQSKVNGKTRRVTIGTHGKLTPEEARERAKKHLVSMIDGIDPNEEKKRNRALSISLEEVVKDFKRDRASKLKPLTLMDIDKIMRFAFKDWQTRPVSAINRDKVSKRFLELTATSKARANLAFRYLRSVLNYARASYRDGDDLPILPENPVSVLSDSRMWNAVQPRNNKIPIDKIGLAWNALHEYRENPVQTDIGRTLGDAAAFIFLTGCRINEACNLTWKRLSTLEKWWHIPDPKNRQSVTFPLPSVLSEILDERPRASEFVFPTKSRFGHITELRTPLERISKAIGLEISAHDLRRTFVSMAGHLGIPLDRCKLLLNHKSQDVTTKHYTETQDLKYLAADLEKISAWVIEQGRIAAEKNVIVFPIEKRIVNKP